MSIGTDGLNHLKTGNMHTICWKKLQSHIDVLPVANLFSTKPSYITRESDHFILRVPCDSEASSSERGKGLKRSD